MTCELMDASVKSVICMRLVRGEGEDGSRTELRDERESVKSR